MKKAVCLSLLLQVPSIGRARVRRLLKLLPTSSTLAQSWHSLPKVARTAGWSPDQIEYLRSLPTPEKYQQKLSERSLIVLCQTDDYYPDLLRLSPDPPLVLYCWGNTNLLAANPKIALVGTRKPTVYGLRAARHLARQVVERSGVVVSGFMYGIDVAAQAEILKHQGQTIGVLGFGFDHMYPQHQRSLLDKWLQQGALFVSEYAPHVRPQPAFFAERNRLIAGMSAATIVIEAAQKSGSLITAQLALDADRSVGAVPGSIFTPYSQGTQALLAEGATLVRNLHDILPDVDRPPKISSASAQPSLSPLQRQIVEVLSESHCTLVELAALLQTDLLQLSQPLLELELQHVIRRQHGFLQLQRQLL